MKRITCKGLHTGKCQLRHLHTTGQAEVDPKEEPLSRLIQKRAAKISFERLEQQQASYQTDQIKGGVYSGVVKAGA